MATKERGRKTWYYEGCAITRRDIIRILIEEASDDIDVAYFETISKHLIIPYMNSLEDDASTMLGSFQGKRTVNGQNYATSDKATREAPPSSKICSVHDVLCLYSPEEFNLYFRMSRSAVEILYRKMCSRVNITAFADDDDLINKYLMTLWLLSSTESFESIGSRFGYSKESVRAHCNQILEVLSSLKAELIYWPTGEECEIICHHFEEKYKFPGIIGLVDCFWIPLKANAEFDSSTAKNSLNGVALQIACDHTFRFRDIFVTTKLVDHMTIFNESNVEEKLLQNRDLLKKDYHVLGGAEYILQDHLLTPYYDNGYLIESQKKYNIIHNNIMNIAEISKKLFINRFCRLDLVDFCTFDITLVVVSCCVLHNFILENDESVDAEVAIGNETDMLCTDTSLTSYKKRNQIAELL